jgi:hypothetical protein
MVFWFCGSLPFESGENLSFLSLPNNSWLLRVRISEEGNSKLIYFLPERERERVNNQYCIYYPTSPIRIRIILPKSKSKSRFSPPFRVRAGSSKAGIA